MKTKRNSALMTRSDALTKGKADYEILWKHQQQRDILEERARWKESRSRRYSKKHSAPKTGLLGWVFYVYLGRVVYSYWCGKMRKRLWLSLFKDVKKYCGTPVTKNAIDDSNYGNCTKCMWSIVELRGRIGNEKDRDARNILYREMADRKLELFYEVSIKGELLDNNDLYRTFQKRLRKARANEDWNHLRVENGYYGEYINKLKEVSSSEVKPTIYESIGVTDECEIDAVWEFMRLCAYRNVYLAKELIDFYRFNAREEAFALASYNSDTAFCLPNQVRTIDALNATMKANEESMRTYTPLKRKVFEMGDISSVTLTDIQQLVEAADEYNKIATSACPFG